MKILLTVLSAAAILAAAMSASGFALDASAVLSIAFAAGIAGLFAADYSRTPRYDLETVKDPVRASRPARAGVEFASLIIFNTTIV